MDNVEKNFQCFTLTPRTLSVFCSNYVLFGVHATSSHSRWRHDCNLPWSVYYHNTGPAAKHPQFPPPLGLGLPPYLCRLCSICHPRRSARTLRSWAPDRARWGRLGASSCPVMDTRKHQSWASVEVQPLNPPLPPNNLNLPQSPDVIMNVIIHVLRFLSHTLPLLPVCSLQTNYSLVNKIFFIFKLLF